MRALCVVGARPNFMKIKPVMEALERRGVDVVLVHTGQHYDRSMSSVFFDELGIRAPDRWLDVGSAGHAEQTARVMMAIDPVITELRPDVVVLVGDVNSTMAASLVAAKSPARLVHVEAGLRSRDWTMPEEVNRLVTDSVCDDLLAPPSPRAPTCSSVVTLPASCPKPAGFFTTACPLVGRRYGMAGRGSASPMSCSTRLGRADRPCRRHDTGQAARLLRWRALLSS